MDCHVAYAPRNDEGRVRAMVLGSHRQCDLTSGPNSLRAFAPSCDQLPPDGPVHRNGCERARYGRWIATSPAAPRNDERWAGVTVELIMWGALRGVTAPTQSRL